MKWIFNFLILVMTTAIYGQSWVKDTMSAYIEQGMRDWKVPGLAIVIVKDGKVVVQKGYGVKDIKTQSPVDDQTHFFIASNSKLFTGMALAKLQSEKKISLNDPMTKYFPSFRLYDSLSTKLVTIKDMLTHRIGTETFQGDFTYWNTKLSSEEIMQRMRYMQPVRGFRDAYGYCNSCYLAAGMVIPAVTGKSWSAYVTDEFLGPLKMNSSYASSNGIQNKSLNIAVPYTTSYSDQLMEVPYDTWDNLAPAASIVSNVSDLAHWLQFQLDSGRYEGQKIMPWNVLQTSRDVVITTRSRKSSATPTHFQGYGLGLFATDYNGRQVYWHTGGAGGMVSNVCFVPEEKLGIAILTNNDNQNFFEILRLMILDDYLDVSYKDRSKMALAPHNADMATHVAEIKAWRDTVQIMKGKTPNLKSYEGTYTHELYGQMTIKANKQQQLVATFHTHDHLTATLSYMGDDTWLAEYNNILYGVYKSIFTQEGDRIKSVSIKVNDFVEYGSYEFIKR
jgi:CubicO group peptidase (beta-lactamase class C family)